MADVGDYVRVIVGRYEGREGTLVEIKWTVSPGVGFAVVDTGGEVIETFATFVKKTDPENNRNRKEEKDDGEQNTLW